VVPGHLVSAVFDRTAIYNLLMLGLDSAKGMRDSYFYISRHPNSLPKKHAEYMGKVTHWLIFGLKKWLNGQLMKWPVDSMLG